MSPPLVVGPAKGNGHIQGQVAFTGATSVISTSNGELELASPIFTHGPSLPVIERQVSEDIMDGVEQASTSDSEEKSTDQSENQLVRVLVPSLDREIDDLGCLKESVRIEWLGTSTFFLAQNIELQEMVSSSTFHGSATPIFP